MIRLILAIYELIWLVCLPVLFFVPRLRDKWSERLLIKRKEKGPFDIWMHAASVGECYIMLELASHLKGLNIIATTNTAQGREILRKGSKGNLCIRYLPFDLSFVLKKALSMWKPELVILIETELWPALLYTCKREDIPVLVINGRLSERSFKIYEKFKGLWKKLSPVMIYAISEEDAKRYKSIFGEEKVKVMSNIKFDRIKLDNLENNPVKGLIPRQRKIVVLGSVRKEEEQDLLWVIQAVLKVLPNCTIALFPRHLERVSWWTKALKERNISYKLRSEITDSSWRADVLVWDRVGELKLAYSIADSVFVGGSLRPCGGHNFLEPLIFGIIPCVGPFIENFNWVGSFLFDERLVLVVKDKKELVRCLVHRAIDEVDREVVKKRFQTFLASKRGGTKTALGVISKFLKKEFKNE